MYNNRPYSKASDETYNADDFIGSIVYAAMVNPYDVEKEYTITSEMIRVSDDGIIKILPTGESYGYPGVLCVPNDIESEGLTKGIYMTTPYPGWGVERIVKETQKTVHQIDEKYLPGKEFIIEAHYDQDSEEFILDTDISDIIANIDLNTKLSIDDGEMVFPITCLEKPGANQGSAAFGMAEIIESLDANGSFIRGVTPGAQIRWEPKPLPYGGGSGGDEEADLVAFIRVFGDSRIVHLNIVFEHDTDPIVSGALISPLDIGIIKNFINSGAIFTAEMGGDYPYPLGTCILSSSGMGFMIRGIQDDQLQYDVWYDIDNECWKKYIPYMPQY